MEIRPQRRERLNHAKGSENVGLERGAQLFYAMIVRGQPLFNSIVQSTGFSICCTWLSGMLICSAASRVVRLLCSTPSAGAKALSFGYRCMIGQSRQRGGA
jgi:hypothetical protein